MCPRIIRSETGLELHVPVDVQSFINYGDVHEPEMIHIADLQNEDLQRIGDAMTEELIARARNARATRQQSPLFPEADTNFCPKCHNRWRSEPGAPCPECGTPSLV